MYCIYEVGGLLRKSLLVMFKISKYPFAFDVEFLPDISVLVKFEFGGGLSLVVRSGSVGDSALSRLSFSWESL